MQHRRRQHILTLDYGYSCVSVCDVHRRRFLFSLPPLWCLSLAGLLRLGGVRFCDLFGLDFDLFLSLSSGYDIISDSLSAVEQNQKGGLQLSFTLINAHLAS